VSLGALLRGDRNAIGAGSELKGFDIDNAHGEKALLRVLQDICGENGSKPMPGVKVGGVAVECRWWLSCMQTEVACAIFDCVLRPCH
jgi:hypothetical protein